MAHAYADECELWIRLLKYDQYGSAWLLLMDTGQWQVGLSAPIRASCLKPTILHESSPHTPSNSTPAPALSTFPLLFIQPCFFTISTPVDLIMEISIHAGPLKSRLVGIGVLFCHMVIPLGKQGVEFAHDLEFWCVGWGSVKGSHDRTGLKN